MYCFIHGLPTRNPGSWIPQIDIVSCGNPRSATLAKDVWPQKLLQGIIGRRMITLENWMHRQEDECDICKAERKRRCCILNSTGSSAAKHLQDPFTSAPFVHPFRHPSYHATQLRAVNFAQTAGKRLHWVVAYDKLLVSAGTSTEDKEMRKERWLEFHDRFTSGIPGIFPGIIDLPMRFTESLGKEAREICVFKHATTIIFGRIPDGTSGAAECVRGHVAK